MPKNTEVITEYEASKPDYLLYTPSLEYLVKSKGEQCEILSKLHLLSHKKYKKKELYFNIPIITITAVVGFISALDIQFDYMNIIIGLLSLYVSLLKSYFSYLQISQKNENHRVAHLQYFQIANEIRIELSLSPDIRQPAAYLLNLIKVKMKNLNEVSEIISTNIIDEFTKQYQYNINYQNISLPDVIISLQPIDIYDQKLLEQGLINQKLNPAEETRVESEQIIV